MSRWRFLTVPVALLSMVVVGVGGCSEDLDHGETNHSETEAIVKDYYLTTRIGMINREGPQSQELIDWVNSVDPKYRFLDASGYVLDWDEMTNQQKTQFQYQLKNHDFDMGGQTLGPEARRDVPPGIRDDARG